MDKWPQNCKTLAIESIYTHVVFGSVQHSYNTANKKI